MRSVCLVTLLSLLLGCGGSGSGGGAAIVRFLLTPDDGSPQITLEDIVATFHSYEDGDPCPLVLYDIEGDDTYVQWLCTGFDASVDLYDFIGLLNPAVGEPLELMAGVDPFATGTYVLESDPTVGGTFEFFVDEVR
jgi:hypothetical protein